MRKADNLPPYRAVVMKSGSLNFLEPSGPPQAYYGRTLLYFYSASSSGCVASDVAITGNHIKDTVLPRLKKNAVIIIEELKKGTKNLIRTAGFRAEI